MTNAAKAKGDRAGSADAPDVWDARVVPGGFVCSACGTPTESEACKEHQPLAYGRGQWATDDPVVTHSRTTTWMVGLPWHTPPLSLNHRLHWRVKARITADVREQAGLAIRAARIPPQQHIHARLHYAPPDRRRRDPDNLTALTKPIFDAAVDSGVIPDDTPQHLDWTRPAIEPVERPGRMWLVITAKETT